MRSSTIGSGRSMGSACSSTRMSRFAIRSSTRPLPYLPLLYSASSAFEKAASAPSRVAPSSGSCAAAGTAVGRSRENIPKRPPFFFSSGVAAAGAGGVHSPARPSEAGDTSASGAEGAHWFACDASSVGGAVGFHAAGAEGPGLVSSAGGGLDHASAAGAGAGVVHSGAAGAAAAHSGIVGWAGDGEGAGSAGAGAVSARGGKVHSGSSVTGGRHSGAGARAGAGAGALIQSGAGGGLGAAAGPEGAAASAAARGG